jgi:hypothetical protein
VHVPPASAPPLLLPAPLLLLLLLPLLLLPAPLLLLLLPAPLLLLKPPLLPLPPLLLPEKPLLLPEPLPPPSSPPIPAGLSLPPHASTTLATKAQATSAFSQATLIRLPFRNKRTFYGPPLRCAGSWAARLPQIAHEARMRPASHWKTLR